MNGIARRSLCTGLALGLMAASLPALAGKTPAPSDASVFFVNLKDGDTVTSPLKVEFGIKGMTVVPAGTETEHSGHHHLLIDRPAFGEGEDGAAEFDNPIPADEHHVHFGKGQLETSVELAPGEHTLQLVLGDYSHIPHDPPVMSAVITVTVE